MLIPLAVLALGAVAAGFCCEHFFVGAAAPSFWAKALQLAASSPAQEAASESVDWLPWAATLAMAGGFVLAYLYYVAVPSLPTATARVCKPLYLFLLHKWYFDELYDWLLVRPAFRLGRFLWKVGDGMIIDGVGPDGVAARVLWAAARIVRLQTGFVYHYAFAMLIGVALIITCFMFYDIGALLSWGIGR
jgi:NADH-quinone oxidoreductase subunit L